MVSARGTRRKPLVRVVDAQKPGRPGQRGHGPLGKLGRTRGQSVGQRQGAAQVDKPSVVREVLAAEETRHGTDIAAAIRFLYNVQKL